MLIKKLAVPLINEKILAQAEHCTIATAALTNEGFDLIVGRLSTKCKVDLLTTLGLPTTPFILKRVLQHFSDRVALKLYTKTVFHANVYIFDLPFRKAVAFVGTGTVTPGGLKDHEEIFWKITDPKEIDALRSWFVGYYEYATPVSEAIIHEYETIYPPLRQREIWSHRELQDAVELTTRGFSWDQIKFKTQFFKKEDFLTFSSDKIAVDTPAVLAEREAVREKLLHLHTLLKRDVTLLKLHEDADPSRIVSGKNTADHADRRVRAMWLTYGRRSAEIKNYSPTATLDDFISLQISIHQKEIVIALVIGRPGGSKEDRAYFHDQMIHPTYREKLLQLLKTLGSGYWIEVAGDRKAAESFQQEALLWDFTKRDDGQYYAFTIGQHYAPGGLALSADNIATTIAKEFEKLVPLYHHIKDKSKE